MTQSYDDPVIPGYVLDDLKRMMVRIAANEHWYKQTWMGIPVWQLAEDLVRLQQLIWDLKPTLIIETGTKFGGSALFFASILHNFKSPQKKGVVSIDLTLNIETITMLRNCHLADLILDLIEGDAADTKVVERVMLTVKETSGPRLIFLDDDHNKEHVIAELDAYTPMMNSGDILIVADTVFQDLAGTPLGAPTTKYPDIRNSNPRIALNDWLERTPSFARITQYTSTGLSNFADGIITRIL